MCQKRVAAMRPPEPRVLKSNSCVTLPPERGEREGKGQTMYQIFFLSWTTGGE